MNDIREQLIKAQNLAKSRNVRLQNVKKQLKDSKEWNDIKLIKPQSRKHVLLKFLTIHNDVMICVGYMAEITRHIGENSLIDKKFYAYPGWESELTRVIEWKEINQ